MFGSSGTGRRSTKPTEAAPLPFTSGVPIVRGRELRTGGAQEPNESGAPCVRPGAMHSEKAGTSATRTGVAPRGRGYPEFRKSAASSYPGGRILGAGLCTSPPSDPGASSTGRRRRALAILISACPFDTCP